MAGRGYQGGGGAGFGGTGFGPPVTPPIIKQIMIVNAAIFMLTLLFGSLDPRSNPIMAYASATPAAFWQGGMLWQPFTYMFLHGGLGHIAMNMFALWMFGSPVAMAWGARRFLRFYLVCGFGAGFLIVSIPYLALATGWGANSILIPTVGASGAVYAVLLAYSLTWPDRTIMLIFPPVAFKAIWLIPLLFFMEIYFGSQGVSHVGHLGGVLVGWLWLRRGSGIGGFMPSMNKIKYRWRRYRMRQKLQAVRNDETTRERSRPRRDDDDHQTLH